MKRLAYLLLPLAACATSDDPCGDAAAHIAACFPDHAIISPSCDPDTAGDIASTSCDELAMRDGKSDGWSCIWMPWLATCGGGSSSTSGKKIEVSVEECGPGALCPYVQSASCGLVTLHKGSAEVARGYSSGGGRLTFEGLAAGEYTVKVHLRNDTLAKMLPDELSDATAPASSKITVGGSGDAPWARFELVNGSAEKLTRCAQSRGNLTVKDRAGHPVDRKLVEWDWIVEHEVDGAIERTRPLFFSENTGENIIDFRLLHTGTHKLRFVRVNIPTYLQKPNPDYDRLRRDYAANTPPIETTFTVSASQVGGTVSINRTITDPLR